MNAAPWLGILLAATMLVVTACLGGSSATPSPTPTLSASPIPTPVYHAPSPTTAAPTFSPTPVPTPDPSVLAIQPCRAEDLVVRYLSGSGQSGTPILYIGVQNVSTVACRILGPPALELFPETGGSTDGFLCGGIASENCANSLTLLEPGAVPQPSGGSYMAYLTISYSNPVREGKTCVPGESAAAIELPDGGGRIDLNGVTIPSCSRAGASEIRLAPTATPVVTPDPPVGYR